MGTVWNCRPTDSCGNCVILICIIQDIFDFCGLQFAESCGPFLFRPVNVNKRASTCSTFYELIFRPIPYDWQLQRYPHQQCYFASVSVWANLSDGRLERVSVSLSAACNYLVTKLPGVAAAVDGVTKCGSRSRSLLFPRIAMLFTIIASKPASSLTYRCLKIFSESLLGIRRRKRTQHYSYNINR